MLPPHLTLTIQVADIYRRLAIPGETRRLLFLKTCDPEDDEPEDIYTQSRQALKDSFPARQEHAHEQWRASPKDRETTGCIGVDFLAQRIEVGHALANVSCWHN